MVASLPTTSLRIGALLSAPFRFAVPAYQRSYSWTTKEAGQLLEDVLAASGVDDPDLAEPDYFFGTILLLDHAEADLPPAAGPPRQFDVVDGQQRILTLTLLAAVLRDLEGSMELPLARRLDGLVRDGGGEQSPRLVLRGREQEFLARHVQLPAGCSVMPEDEELLTEGERAILSTREQYLQELGRLSPEERAQVADYLAEHCHVVVILTKDIDRAHRYFTVLNERGKPLLRNDILKAEVLRSVIPDRLEPVIETWDRIALRLGPNFETFFSHLRAAHGHSRPEVIAGVRAVISQAGGAEAFVLDTMVPMSAAFEAVRHPDVDGASLPDRARHLIAYLNRLRSKEWIPPVLVALVRYSADNDEDALLRALGEIDRLAHLLQILCLGNGKRARRLQIVANVLRRGDELTHDHECIALSRDEVRKIQYNIRDLYAHNQQVVRQILLRAFDQRTGHFTRLDMAAFNIEHVLPLKPGARSQWRHWHPDMHQREAAMGSLGNLMLVPPTVNNRLRNAEFKQKREICLKERQRFAPLEATIDEVFASLRWGRDEIVARETRMLNSLGELWRIDLADASALR